MQRLWIALAACYALSGQSLTTLEIGPDPAGWNGSGGAVASYRVEFRVEGVQASSRIVSNGEGIANLNCRIDGSLALMCTQGGDGTPDGVPAWHVTAGQDVRARFQRDGSGLTYTLETWNGDCTGYQKQQFRITDAGKLAQSARWVVGPNVNLAFLRLYNGTDATAGCPVDAPDNPADVFDFTFENGSLVDRSAHGYSLGGIGRPGVCGAPPCFADSAPYPPRAAIGGWTSSEPVFTAGAPIEFSGAGSVSFTYPGNGSVAGYSWRQVSGPADSAMTGEATGSPSITPPVPGQYTYELTVTDANGASGTVQQSVGVVGADANGVVTQSDADFAWVLGSTQPFGKSPWPWYEATEAADADLLSPLMRQAPALKLEVGTLRVETGPGAPNFVNADGAIEARTYENIAWKGIGTNFTQADAGKRIVVVWDADGNGTNQGRRVVYINRVIDATTIVGNDYNMIEPPGAFSAEAGQSWGYAGTDFAPYNASDPNSFILMFYEAGLAVGRLYGKTGLEKYQTEFHAFCDNWWRWALNSGYSIPLPRNSGLHTMIACASDPSYSAPAGMWDGIARLTRSTGGRVPTSGGSEPAYNPADPATPGMADVRETSYVLRPTALLARLYGKHGGDTQAWCGYLANQLNNMWIHNAAVPLNAPSSNYAFWEENLFINNVTYVAASHPAGDPNGHFGTSPWRSAGLPSVALTYSYDALNDASACNNPALAQALFNPVDGSGLIANAANYVWDYGRSADGGLLYSEGYETDTGNTPGWTVFNSFPANGYVNVTSGSTAVVGSGTYFKAQFGPCNGSTQIVIGGATYGVAGCADDTHLTLGSAYKGGTQNGIGNYSNPATIAVTNGSDQVAGSGTKFTVLYAPCDGTTYIGIVGSKNQYVDRRVYQVTGCADDTHLTLNLPYAGPTESGLNVFSRAHRAHQDCGPQSISSYCEPDQYNGRNLSADVAASAAWLYAHTGNAQWKSRAEYYANKVFGGPAAGAGALGGPSGSCVYSRPGTINVNPGDTAVTGTGTLFTQQFACDGSDRITIADGSAGLSWANPPGLEPAFYTLGVAACPSDTSLTLASPYPGSAGTKIAMFYNPADAQWQCADGGAGNLGEILPSCRGSGPPCGIGDLVPKYGKPLGMASGAGDVPVMLANLLGGSQAQQAANRTMYVNFKLASVPRAVKVRVTLRESSGAATEITCSKSPCRVTARETLRGSGMKLDYLAADGSVLETRELAKAARTR